MTDPHHNWSIHVDSKRLFASRKNYTCRFYYHRDSIRSIQYLGQWRFTAKKQKTEVKNSVNVKRLLIGLLIFTPVCHSVHGGGGGRCLQFFGGEGFLQIFGGGGLQIFGGGCLQFFGGGVFLQIFGCVCGGGGFLQILEGGLQILEGVSNFSGGGSLQFSEYGQRSAGTHPTGMHSCYSIKLHLKHGPPQSESENNAV